jgi:hypothetical protein
MRQDEQGRARPANGQPQSECEGEGQARRTLADVERDDREPGAPHETISHAQGDIVASAAAHPQQAPEIHPGPRGGRGIEGVVGVYQRGHRPALRDFAQAIDEQARASGRRRTHDLRDLAPHDHAHYLSRVEPMTRSQILVLWRRSPPR